jgi:hypothetical protein
MMEEPRLYRGPDLRHPAGVVQAAKGSSATDGRSTRSWSART